MQNNAEYAFLFPNSGYLEPSCSHIIVQLLREPRETVLCDAVPLIFNFSITTVGIPNTTSQLSNDIGTMPSHFLKYIQIYTLLQYSTVPNLQMIGGTDMTLLNTPSLHLCPLEVHEKCSTAQCSSV